jgi:hypothetical protein
MSNFFQTSFRQRILILKSFFFPGLNGTCHNKHINRASMKNILRMSPKTYSHTVKIPPH